MAAMFSRLSGRGKIDDYEDLDDNVEMDITDMYKSLGKTPPVKSASVDTVDRSSGQLTQRSQVSESAAVPEGQFLWFLIFQGILQLWSSEFQSEKS